MQLHVDLVRAVTPHPRKAGKIGEFGHEGARDMREPQIGVCRGEDEQERGDDEDEYGLLVESAEDMG